MLKVALVAASWPLSGMAMGVLAHLIDRSSSRSSVYKDDPISLRESLIVGVFLGWVWVAILFGLAGLSVYDVVSRRRIGDEYADG